MHFIETYTGKQFYIFSVRLDDICIEDIAHSLSLLCRYNGHCKSFYSVAEHSLLIAEYAATKGYGPEDCLRALLHDAVEAYIGDIPKPIKMDIPELEGAERTIEHAIMKKYSLPTKKEGWLRDLDRRIQCDEREELMSDSGNVWMHDDLEPLGVYIECLTPAQAEEHFLNEFRTLTGEIG